MIGTLFSDDSFRWKQTNGSDFWGRCGGTAQMCGWVPSTYLTPGGSANIVCGGSGSTATGVGSRQYLLANFAKCVNDYVPGVFFIDSSSGNRVHIPAGLTANLYGNYDGTIVSPRACDWARFDVQTSTGDGYPTAAKRSS